MIERENFNIEEVLKVIFLVKNKQKKQPPIKYTLTTIKLKGLDLLKKLVSMILNLYFCYLKIIKI